MSILDTFYILFKSNTDEAVKSNQKIAKSAKDTGEEFKKASDEAEKLGKNFVKVVENATSAMAAVFSLGAIKAGIMNAAAFNSSLEVQGRLMGQNVQDIKAYGAAVEAAGGSVEGFQDALKSAFSAAANAGLPLPPVDVLMRRYHDAIQGLSKNQAAFRLGQLGVTDPGMMALLEQSDAEFEKSIAAAREHARVTQGDTEAAREFESAWSKAGQSLDTLYTQIGSDLLPAVTALIKDFTGFTDTLKDNKLGMYEFFGGMAAVAATAGAAVAKLAAGLIGLGGGAGILAGLSRTLGVAGVAYAGSQLLINGSYAIGQGIGHWWKGDGSSARTATSGPAAQQSMQFWMSQGYSREAAAGIAANEMRESGGNPSARGDGGRASGLYQWHPDRVAAILTATGIDVRTASAADQRRAAAWEVQNMGLADKLKNLSDPDAAAALFSRQFERPANGAIEAVLRGQSALALASSTPFSSASGASGGWGVGDRNVAVKIDNINVQTQATDASGITGAIAQELTSHLRSTVSNYDDGIAR